MWRLIQSTIVILLLLVLTQAFQSNPAINDKHLKAPAGTGTISLLVRDTKTGYAVPATVSYGPIQGDWSMPFSQRADTTGRIRLTLSAGTYLFEACAPGYDSMRTYFRITAGTDLPTGFQMDPTVSPEEMRPEVLDAQVRPGHAMTFGYVVDAETGKPLANVRVRWETTQVDTRTNLRGYYALFAPVPSADPNALPPTDTLVAELPGYRRFVYHRFPLWEGQWSRTNMELERGDGTTEQRFTARWMPDDGDNVQAQEPEHSSPRPIPTKLLRWLSVPSHPCP